MTGKNGLMTAPRNKEIEHPEGDLSASKKKDIVAKN